MRNAIFIVALAAIAIAVGTWTYHRFASAPAAGEVPVMLIPLAGEITEPRAEISSLAWYGDQLILLPQYPGRTRTDEHPDGFLYAIPKADILAVLDGREPGPLTPRPIPLSAPDLADDIKGFEGYEAIAFDGDRMYLTIESKNKHTMSGHLVAGEISPDLSAMTIDTTAYPWRLDSADFVGAGDGG